MSEGPSFLVRGSLLDPSLEACISPGRFFSTDCLVLDEEASSALLSAAHAYLAERTAMGYLARAEHSRFGLSLKLERKGFSRDEIAPTLDRLVDNGYLDDVRFAEAWLRNRSIHQSEGRQKLLAGLLSRGIGSADAKLALDRFFDVTAEVALCRRAAEKLRRLGKDKGKLRELLMKKGFSGKIIKEILLQNGENEI